MQDRISELSEGLDARIGYRKLLHELLDEKLPGGASWAYVFGSCAFILFLVQVGTGLALAMYYSPSATDAWASIAYLEREITMGTLVRGMHHHSAGAMVVVVILHMLQVVIFGAYKAPREANWLAGLGLLGLVLAFALTGYLLPWDQTGYWATKVATSIAGTVPVAGPLLQEVAQGGNDYGNLTLTRFYALHVILLPILTLGLIGVHVALFRKHGVTPSASKTPAQLKRIELFYPRQMLYDAVFATLAIGVVAWLAVSKGAPLEAPAEPASNFIARPEWYFLFLFQLLKYFEGPLQVVGTVIIPGLATVFLAVLPFLDRGPSRALHMRKPWVGAIVAGLVAMVALTALAVQHDAKDPKIAEQKERSHREAARARALAANGVPPAGAAYMMAHDPLTRGERVFERECASCHALEGRSPEKAKAPDLTAYGSRAWIRQVLRDPDSKRLFGLTKVEGMKSFADRPEKEITDLVEIVYAQRDPKSPPIAARPGVALLDELECTNCHDFEEATGIEGPTLFRYLSREWIREVVDDASAVHLYDKANDMPIFAARITEEDRAAVVEFLLSLEKRGRKDMWPFVDDPGPIPTPRPGAPKKAPTAPTE